MLVAILFLLKKPAGFLKAIFSGQVILPEKSIKIQILSLRKHISY